MTKHSSTVLRDYERKLNPDTQRKIIFICRSIIKANIASKNEAEYLLCIADERLYK